MDEIEAIRRTTAQRTAAVEAGDLELLGCLMTGDLVVIHGNGRLVCGKEAMTNDFARSFQGFTVQQTVESEETIVAGQWAFDRAKVHTTIKPRHGGDKKEFESRTVTTLRKESGAIWRVARTIGVVRGKQNRER